MAMKLLACIASHNPEERKSYLFRIINVLSIYNMDVDIILDVNKQFEMEGVKEVCVHTDLPHPYMLTWCHREHIKTHISEYDWFMYLEDDMWISPENFMHYTENFNLLWDKYVPSFVRIETFNEEKYITDVTSYESSKSIFSYKGKQWIELSNPYHAFWIMSREALISSMPSNFKRLETWRELAASFPMWELKKKPIVEIKDGQINPLCYSFHLPNNYASFSGTPFGKIKINELIK